MHVIGGYDFVGLGVGTSFVAQNEQHVCQTSVNQLWTLTLQIEVEAWFLQSEPVLG